MSCSLRIPSFALVALSLTVPARTARADDAPVSKESIATDMDEYYAGEARSAYGIAALSVASVGGGAVLVTRPTDFARGLGWPLLVLGAVEGVGAVFYAFQVSGERRHYRDSLTANPAAFRDEELAHMRGTTKRFIFYQATELGLTLAGAGIATYGFATNKDVLKGAGLGLAAIGLPFLVIDAVNNKRAARYRDEVQRLDPASAHDQPFEDHAPYARVLGGPSP
ncbi:MAG: hypothetical protein ABI183_11190, partial [Polyangiaceae bacterium]